jgi:UDP-N-acetylmuramoylalanine-D-glutamate ligase
VHLIGNIGVPALELAKESIGKEDIFVMELSSYQCEDLDWSPHISVVTSIFPEHLDHHGSLESYIAAKKQIIANATSGDFLVFSPEYKELRDLAENTSAKAVPFISDIPFDIVDSKLKGSHNLANIRAALTVARLCDISDDVTQKAVLAFEPLPHRMKEIGIYKGIRFVDDAIATAPEPTIFAIETFGDVDTLFLGGQDRGYDFSELVNVILKHKIQNLVLFPDTADTIGAALKNVSNDTSLNILKTSSMEEAVRFAYEHTEKGKTCLLSMASPSYSLWKNFEEKGNEFVKYVKEFAAETN